MAEILNKIVAKATGMQYAAEDPLVLRLPRGLNWRF